MRGGLLAACGLTAGLWLGCPPDKPGPAKLGLRVPLPDGWEASPQGAALEAGPPGRAVVVLESRTSPLPSVDELLAALATEGVVIQAKESTPEFIGARYALTGDGGQVEGFLAVKQVGQRTVWCSSTAQAGLEQVREGFALCRAVGLEPR
jgi:hypothetical protein